MKTGYSFSGLNKVVIHCAGLRCFKQVVVGLAVALVAFTGLSQPMPTDFFDFNYTDGSGPIGAPVISGNVMYGVTVSGNLNTNANEPDTKEGTGTIYRVNTDGTGFANLYNFSAALTGYNGDGTGPHEGLAFDGIALYGTTQDGGLNDVGTVFKINIDGTGFTVLHTFDHGEGSTDGYKPFALGCLVVTNGTVYGMASSGGANEGGTVFKVNTDGSGYANIYNFFSTSDDGGKPGTGSLTIQGDTLYGTTTEGGSGVGDGGGTVFSIKTNGDNYTTLFSFPTVVYGDTSTYLNSTGSCPAYGVVLSDGTLYGTTTSAGAYGYGTLFSINTNGTGFTTLLSFTNAQAIGNLIVACSSIYGQIGAQLFSVNTDGTGFEFLTTNVAPSNVGTNFTGVGITLSGNTIYGPGYTNDTSFGLTLAGVSGSLLKTPADVYAVSQPNINGVYALREDDGSFFYTVYFDWNPLQLVSGVPEGAMLELQDGEFPDYIDDDVFVPVTAAILEFDSERTGADNVTFPECYPDPGDLNIKFRIRYINCGITGPWSAITPTGN